MLKIRTDPSIARLLDFGKFLELVFYSDALYRLSAPLCEHTSPDAPNVAQPVQHIPEPRFCVIRSFSKGSVTIAFTMAPVQGIFEARIPRCQVTRSIAEVSRRDLVSPDDDEWLRIEKDRLRLDMTFTWKGLKDQLRWLVGIQFLAILFLTSYVPLQYCRRT